MLAPPGWRIAGTLDADATLSGNRAAPRWNGTLGADELALRALVEGLDLRDGRLRATLDGNRVDITEFTLQGRPRQQHAHPGPERQPQHRGERSRAATAARCRRSGDWRWGAAPAAGAGSGIRMAMQAQLRALRVLVRTDRQVTLSGDLQARLDSGQFTVRGDLKTDRAVIILPDETAPSLGSDVVVRSAAKDREAAEEAEAPGRSATQTRSCHGAQTAKPPDIAVELRPRQRLRGAGPRHHDAAGRQARHPQHRRWARRRASPARSAPCSGQYRAYGQQLDVETGIARFNGPFDNPALDILAIRPNITQRAGVQITGTAQSPRVRLYSEPAAVRRRNAVLGDAGPRLGHQRRRIGLLQQAALALLGGLGSGGTGGGLASRFGLDEIGFKGPGSGGDAARLGRHAGQAPVAGLLRDLRAQPGRHAGHALHLLRPDPAPHAARPGRRSTAAST